MRIDYDQDHDTVYLRLHESPRTRDRGAGGQRGDRIRDAEAEVLMAMNLDRLLEPIDHFHQDRNIWTFDRSTHKLLKFDQQGRLLYAWARPGCFRARSGASTG